jgi:hypothetical protein
MSRLTQFVLKADSAVTAYLVQIDRLWREIASQSKWCVKHSIWSSCIRRLHYSSSAGARNPNACFSQDFSCFKQLVASLPLRTMARAAAQPRLPINCSVKQARRSGSTSAVSDVRSGDLWRTRRHTPYNTVIRFRFRDRLTRSSSAFALNIDSFRAAGSLR